MAQSIFVLLSSVQMIHGQFVAVNCGGPSCASHSAANSWCDTNHCGLAVLDASNDAAARETCATTGTFCWIGLTKTGGWSATQGTWAWSDGSALDYGFSGGEPTQGTSPWGTGQPNNPAAATCIELGGADAGGYCVADCAWDDASSCSTAGGYGLCNECTPSPTTAEPTTAEPTTAEPTTAEPTTAEPTNKSRSGSGSGSGSASSENAEAVFLARRAADHSDSYSYQQDNEEQLEYKLLIDITPSTLWNIAGCVMAVCFVLMLVFFCCGKFKVSRSAHALKLECADSV